MIRIIFDSIKRAFETAIQKNKFKNILYLELVKLIMYFSIFSLFIFIVSFAFFFGAFFELKNMDDVLIYSAGIGGFICYIFYVLFKNSIIASYGDLVNGKSPRIEDISKNLKKKSILMSIVSFIDHFLLIIFWAIPLFFLHYLIENSLEIEYEAWQITLVFGFVLLFIHNVIKNCLMGLIIYSISYERGIFSFNLIPLIKKQIKIIPYLFLLNLFLFILKIIFIFSIFVFGIGLYLYPLIYNPVSKMSKLYLYSKLKL